MQQIFGGSLASRLGGAGGGNASQILGGMFGTGPTPTSPMGIAGGVADTIGSFIPKKEQHSSVETADAVFDSVSNTLMAIPGWGTVAGGIMKVGGLLADGLTAMGVGTDQMTKLDRALDSKFLKLLPSSLINATFAKKTRDFKMDQETYKDQGSAYEGTYDEIRDAEGKAGKKYGLYSSKQRKQANAEIDEAERKENIIQDINEQAQTNLNAQKYWGNSFRSQMLTGGGYRALAVGRKGLKLDINRARKIIHTQKFKEGGSIITEISLIDPTLDAEQFKDGGSIIKSTEINLVDVIPEFQDGGSINVIPEGALHARKHNMDMEGITKKGIPVIDNKGEQQAEIERSEIILRLELTQKLEELEREYKKEEGNKKKREIALEAGKLLIDELLNNTIDNTGELL